MKYLVLRSFRSFGKTLHKGEVVDEAAIRSPRLRRSEGKIIPAVSSSAAPEESVVAAPVPQVPATNEEVNKAAQSEPDKEPVEKPKLSLSFRQ